MAQREGRRRPHRRDDDDGEDNGGGDDRNGDGNGNGNGNSGGGGGGADSGDYRSMHADGREGKDSSGNFSDVGSRIDSLRKERRRTATMTATTAAAGGAATAITTPDNGLGASHYDGDDGGGGDDLEHDHDHDHDMGDDGHCMDDNNPEHIDNDNDSDSNEELRLTRAVASARDAFDRADTLLRTSGFPQSLLDPSASAAVRDVAAHASAACDTLAAAARVGNPLCCPPKLARHHVLDNPFFLFAAAKTLQARCLDAAGRYDDALALLEHAVTVFPDAVEARVRRANARRAVAIDQAMLALCEQDWTDAVAIAERIGRDRAKAKVKATAGANESAPVREMDADGSNHQNDEHDDNQDDDDDQKHLLSAEAGAELSFKREARDALILFLCQEDRAADAHPHLKAGGFTVCLSRHVLAYPLSPPPCGFPLRLDIPFVRAVDAALPPLALRHMRRAFAPQSVFWSEHNYGPQTPYFSYTSRLDGQDPDRDGDGGGPGDGGGDDDDRVANALTPIIRHLHAVACALFPESAALRTARVAEWWAHSRPHSHAHQLHFDSDDEGNRRTGAGKPRHPVFSSVLYLGDGGDDGGEGEDNVEDEPCVGGPTLVTNQRLGDPLADRGWLVMPRVNRFVVFDGAVLHGVIPGRGPVPATHRRRVSFMVAFWPDLTVAPASTATPGSARRFPPLGRAPPPGPAADTALRTTTTTVPTTTWPQLHAIADDDDKVGDDDAAAAALGLSDDPTAVAARAGRGPAVFPAPVDAVWELVGRGGAEQEADAEAGGAARGGGGYVVGYSRSRLGLPSYAQCFQGF
ncbi:hypothetical protein DFJ73DRAFT_798643 [Zopfochytrium polystomum]|nr:hypothetical protein DFJ73DRAFT_798643 [Zopfochytrium polystomum]